MSEQQYDNTNSGTAIRSSEPIGPFPTGQQLAEVLQSFGIIDACAVDDPEGYDNYETLEAVNAAAKCLRSVSGISPSRDA